MNRSTTVVMPLYNQARYLFRAVSSIYWQLGPGDRIIIVDDASSDLEGPDVIAPFLDRVLWLRNEVNRGAAFSRNSAIREATTEWIKFLDADDVLAPYAMNAILHDAALPDYVKVLTGGCHRVIDYKYCDLMLPTENIQYITYVNPMLPSATFVRRQTLLDVGGFDERIDFEEDWDLWLKIHEKFGRDAFASTPQPFCFYWIEKRDRELSERTRKCTVDGVPVREYLKLRYGITPLD